MLEKTVCQLVQESAEDGVNFNGNILYNDFYLESDNKNTKQKDNEK